MQTVRNHARTYIAIDLKSFYASVECVERGLDPLTTNLVVADETRTQKTICLAVSPTLKAYGLSGRSRLFEVVQKAQEVKRTTGRTLDYITAPPRMALYIDYSTRIYKVYLKYFSPDDIHVYSIDEVFIDATQYLALYGMDAPSLARKVVQDVLASTGITATAGIAPNLYLCKIAMDIEAKHIQADRNGVRIAFLDEESYRRKLWSHRPLSDFWRIGAATEERLRKNGLFTMGDIARRSVTDENSLYRIFGIDAEILIDHAWGYEPCTISDIKAYRSSNTSFGSGQVLSCPYPKEKARLIIKGMAESLALDMVDKGIASASFTLIIGYDRENIIDGTYTGATQKDRYGREVPKGVHGTVNLGAPTASAKKILAGLLSVFDRIVDEGQTVKRINITADSVIAQKEEQADLFISAEQQQKEQKIMQTMLSIQKKFGKNAILKGNDLEEGATTIERNNMIGGHRA